jgi:hypothetical protein
LRFRVAARGRLGVGNVGQMNCLPGARPPQPQLPFRLGLRIRRLCR